ncbi:MAG: hypothetical protein ACRC9R_01635 [Enterovibrio sp.]
MINADPSYQFLPKEPLSEEKASALMQGHFGAIREANLQRLVFKMVQNRELLPAFTELKLSLDAWVELDERGQTKARIVQQAVLGYEKAAIAASSRAATAAPQSRAQEEASHAQGPLSTPVSSRRRGMFEPIFAQSSTPALSAASYALSRQTLQGVAQQLETQAPSQLSLDFASVRTRHLFLHLHAALTQEFQNSLFEERAGLSNGERLAKLFAPEFDEQAAPLQAQSARGLSKSQLLKVLVATLRGYGAALPESLRADFSNKLAQILQQDLHSNSASSLETISFTNLLFGTKNERELACRKLMSEKSVDQNVLAMLKVKRSVAQLLQLFLESFVKSQTAAS